MKKISPANIATIAALVLTGLAGLLSEYGSNKEMEAYIDQKIDERMNQIENKGEEESE